MQICLPLLFCKIDSQSASRQAEDPVLLCDTFYSSRLCNADEGMSIMLTANHLYICDNLQGLGNNTALPSPNKSCELDFDVKFELMRDTSINLGTTGGMGVPYCIKLEKDGYEGLDVYASSETLLKWKDHLESKINRRGFHSLFRPIKKIGKGNFASVYLA